MAAGFHERKVNGNICPEKKNFELSVINHLPPLESHGMGVSFNFKYHLWNNFANHNIQDVGKQVFLFMGCKSCFRSFYVHVSNSNYNH